MNRVEIIFDCLPLRSVTRLDIPIDASPGYRRKLESIKKAIEKHGTHNTYYLHNASCEYFLTNSETIGRLKFSFEGTAFTDSEDRNCLSTKLNVKLLEESCDWLTEPIVNWFTITVEQSVKQEFNRYINAGDLSKTEARIKELQAKEDTDGTFLGMYL